MSRGECAVDCENQDAHCKSLNSYCSSLGFPDPFLNIILYLKLYSENVLYMNDEKHNSDILIYTMIIVKKFPISLFLGQ